MRIAPEFCAERLADIANFKRDEAILQIGRFGHPPALEDVADLTLDDSDIPSLRGCRVGDCGVQLSAEAISRFRHEVDWQRADVHEQAHSLMRKVLVEYVTAYMNVGTAASMQYVDQPEPVNPGRESLSMAQLDVAGWQQSRLSVGISSSIQPWTRLGRGIWCIGPRNKSRAKAW